MRLPIDVEMMLLAKKLEDPLLSSRETMDIEDKLEEMKHERRMYVDLVEHGVGEAFLSATLDTLKLEELIVANLNVRSRIHRFKYTGDKFVISSSDEIELYGFLKGFATTENIMRGSGLIIVGNIGSGKTHTAIAVLRAMLESKIPNMVEKDDSSSPVHFEYKQPTFRFIQAQDIIALMLSKDYNAEKYLDEIRNVDILTIDDLGAEKHVEAWGTIEQLSNRVVKYRDHKNLVTIITSNTDPQKFTDVYGQRAASVLFGSKYSHISIVTERSWREIK